MSGRKSEFIQKCAKILPSEWSLLTGRWFPRIERYVSPHCRGVFYSDSMQDKVDFGRSLGRGSP
jgi:hypothetical protein